MIMRRSIVILIFFISSGMLFSHNNEYSINNAEILILDKPSTSNYQNIVFTRKNIIIKQGAITGFK